MLNSKTPETLAAGSVGAFITSRLVESIPVLQALSLIVGIVSAVAAITYYVLKSRMIWRNKKDE